MVSGVMVGYSNMQHISIIIPIYNSTKTLSRCLESVYMQDYSGIEVILVDDGSTDDSAKIIDDYCERYHGHVLTRVIHTNHCGLINARIAGLQKADSEWVAFVDADDWIEKDHISRMVRDLEGTEADLVLEGCVRHEGGREDVNLNRFPCGVYGLSEIKEKIYPKMLYYDGFFSFGLYPYMWNKLFRKQALLECYDLIDTSVFNGEDVLAFFTYMVTKVKRLVIGDAHTYHYCLTAASMTNHNDDPGYLKNVASLYLSLDNVFSRCEEYSVLRPQLDQYIRMMVKKSSYEGFIQDDRFFFPYAKVSHGSRIILYGAGFLGKHYVHQMNMTGYCSVVAWVDKNYELIKPYEGIEITSPERINTLSYDCIVIALIDGSSAEAVKKTLIADHGVAEDKIIV